MEDHGEIYDRSAIPKYDDSAMIVTVIGTAPPLSNPRKNRNSEILIVKRTTGKGAFSDLTYLIFTDVKGGAAPSNKKCGTIYPNGYIYPVPFTGTLLYYYLETK
ncbi:hypothetical protein F8M41_011092 [Gigaspora margarita]|uniref:Uncharacterized protein n=1 Tax=Gigaspora margarita TaxID=4874 RepID=A0A8H4AU15_GIGMA|nr:hypothetical protein F8M41_011092 [Gigaspora margarita]